MRPGIKWATWKIRTYVLGILVHARERCSLAGLLLFSRSGLLFDSANEQLNEVAKLKEELKKITQAASAGNTIKSSP